VKFRVAFGGAAFGKDVLQIYPRLVSVRYSPGMESGEINRKTQSEQLKSEVDGFLGSLQAA
jgi:hypothetical protein